MSVQNGGSAFPIYDPDGVNWPIENGYAGMTLRDYFAAKAMTGYLAAFSGQDIRLPNADEVAHEAYSYADAMLAEREKGKPT